MGTRRDSRPPADVVQQVVGLDHVEVCVSNLPETARWYEHALRLPRLAATDAGSDRQARQARVLGTADGARIMLSAPAADNDGVAHYLSLHGEGVRDIALAVVDAEAAFHQALLAGAKTIAEPARFESSDGAMTVATIGAFGDVVHSLVQREEGSTWWYPGMTATGQRAAIEPPTVSGVDHLAVCLTEGTLDAQVEFYQRAFGFCESYDDYVATANSAMRGRIVESVHSRVRIPLWEAGAGPKRSQVNEFVHFNAGPGVQHAAFVCDDIVSAVTTLRERGVAFVPVPEMYYSSILEPDPALAAELPAFARLGIVIDKDDSGYLMQVFTKPQPDRPTFFWEIIQRRGSRSFGGVSIRRLFEAIEREQQLRNTL